MTSDTVLNSTVQCSRVQCSTVQYCAQHQQQRAASHHEGHDDVKGAMLLDSYSGDEAVQQEA